MVKAFAALAAVVLAGCTTSSALLNNPNSPAAPPDLSALGTGAKPLGSEGIGIYLKTLRDLLEGDPVTQADAFRSAAAAADAAPTTTNRLNYALALATPGHPSADPEQAERLLSELLAAGDTLLPEERILALVHLKEVEQRLILDAEADRAQRAASAAASQRNDQSAERLRAAVEENAKLRAELNEARAKLEAITNIERSIRERENGSNPQ